MTEPTVCHKDYTIFCTVNKTTILFNELQKLLSGIFCISAKNLIETPEQYEWTALVLDLVQSRIFQIMLILFCEFSVVLVPLQSFPLALSFRILASTLCSLLDPGWPFGHKCNSDWVLKTKTLLGWSFGMLPDRPVSCALCRHLVNYSHVDNTEFSSCTLDPIIRISFSSLSLEICLFTLVWHAQPSAVRRQSVLLPATLSLRRFIPFQPSGSKAAGLLSD